MSDVDLTGLIEKRNHMGTLYYVDKEGIIKIKGCTKCKELKYVEEFSRHAKALAQREPNCRECRTKYRKENIKSRRDYSNKWRENNRERHRETSRLHYRNNTTQYINRNLRRRAKKHSLPNDLTNKQLSEVVNHFKGGCALTGVKENIHMDHVIPVHSGHGGTVYGNVIPLQEYLNLSKHNLNIFEWFLDNHERLGISQHKFDKLIKYLANVNDMTPKEYEEYVYWCHDNPRDLVGKSKEGGAS